MLFGGARFREIVTACVDHLLSLCWNLQAKRTENHASENKLSLFCILKSANKDPSIMNGSFSQAQNNWLKKYTGKEVINSLRNI
jgi:hypothetical protein